MSTTETDLIHRELTQLHQAAKALREAGPFDKLRHAETAFTWLWSSLVKITHRLEDIEARIEQLEREVSRASRQKNYR